jgi:hypothetical protein
MGGAVGITAGIRVGSITGLFVGAFCGVGVGLKTGALVGFVEAGHRPQRTPDLMVDIRTSMSGRQYSS